MRVTKITLVMVWVSVLAGCPDGAPNEAAVLVVGDHDAGAADGQSTDSGAPADGGGADVGCVVDADCVGLSGPCATGICVDGACEATMLDDGTVCDDGLFCTMGEACQAGECGGGEARDCSEAGSACAVGTCEEATEACVPKNAENDTPCDDDDEETSGDRCVNGVCLGYSPDCQEAVDCEDLNPCTSNACADGACVFEPEPAGVACDDGLACTDGDACNGVGGCSAGAAMDCGALTGPCATGICTEAAGGCTVEPFADGTVCDDGDAQTAGDQCTGGVCAGIQGCTTVADCEDDNVCTVDACEGGGCLHLPAPAGSPCEDAYFCTDSDTCNGAGGCVAGPARDCSAQDGGCSVGTCDEGAAACLAQAQADGSMCDDGDPSTIGEACLGGICVGQPAECLTDAECDDQEPCTTDLCGGGLCVHTAVANGSLCDDKNPCTSGDSCQQGVCTAAGPKDCGALATDCQTAYCAAALGGCAAQAKSDGTSCDDGNAATFNDVCVAGACVGKAAQCLVDAHCDDGLGCTDDACVGGLCQHLPMAVGTACSDGLYCTDGDVCDALGACVAGAARDCSAQDSACTYGVCSEFAKACVAQNASDGMACDDGDMQTVNDQCAQGACAGLVPGCLGDGDCDDGSACTTDVCVDSACHYVPVAVSTPCDDGLVCTVGDSCNALGVCVGGPAPDCSGLTTDCAVGVCDAVSGCMAVSLADGQGCSDGNPKTIGDQCVSGVCQGGAQVSCNKDSQCKSASSACAVGKCKGGKCKSEPKNNGSACEDGLFCTTGDVCQSGECVPAGPTDCASAAGVCQSAVCDEAIGACVAAAVPNGTACDDQQASTVNDHCIAGACAGVVPACTTNADCNDQNLCTLDTCVNFGCVHQPTVAGSPCSDGAFCTVNDVCDGAGGCFGAPNDCAKTVGTCQKAQCNEQTDVCAAVAVADGSACDDSDAATVLDTCFGGVCIGSVPECLADGECDDSNPCTTDSCAAFVCKHSPKPVGAACNDGAFCTVGDSCDGVGGCQAGKARDCGAAGGVCAVGVCNDVSDSCVTQNASDGTACDDGVATTVKDVCVAGSCVGVVPECQADADCNDSNACTSDACSGFVCVHGMVAAGVACTDGLACTGPDVCDGAGACVGGPAPDCSAKSGACTAGVCDPSSGGCVAQNLSDGTACSDGDPATVQDKCQSGACVGIVASCTTDAACDDGDPCTKDSCNGIACVHAAASSGTACDDGLVCSSGDQCDGAGTCLSGPPTDCGAVADACNGGVCNEAAGGCVQQPLADGTACDDGDPATLGDACLAGACAGIIPQCATNADCDDADPCTSDTCSAYVCSHKPASAGAPCDDGFFCTSGDTCDGAGGCVGGAPPACDDGVACTIDGCDIVADGCTHTLNDAACSDGLYCTGVETCSQTGCLAGPAPCVAPQTCDEVTQACTGINPTAPDELAFQAALAFYTTGQYTQAIVAFKAFMLQYPTSVRVDNAAYLIAKSYFLLLDYATAKQKFAAFLLDYPTSKLADDATYYLGRSMFALAQYALALGVFQSLPVDYPLSPYLDNALYWQGRSEYQLGQYQQALVSFDGVIALPLSVYRDQSMYWAGRSQYEWGVLDLVQPSPHFAAADVYFAQFLTEFGGLLSSYEDNVHFYYGMSAFKAGNWLVAVARLDVIRTTFPLSNYYDNAWFYIGYAHYKALDYTTAITELDAFIAAIPVSSKRDNALYFAGRAFYKRGVAGTGVKSADYTAAAARFSQLLTETPTSAYADNAAYYRGRSYRHLAAVGVTPAANRTLAIASFDLVITTYPTSGYADNAYRWKIETQVDQVDCAGAAATLQALQAAFPASNQLPAAQAAVLGC